MDQELVAYLDGRFMEFTHELRAETAAQAAETRRHFDVVAERLRDELRLLADGVAGVDQKLERFRAEVAEQFRRVDRRLLRLEAHAAG